MSDSPLLIDQNNNNPYEAIENDEIQVRAVLNDLLNNYQKQKIVLPDKGNMKLTQCNFF